MTTLVLAATFAFAAQGTAPDAGPAPIQGAPTQGAPASAAPAASPAPGFLDRAQAAQVSASGQAGVANALVPGSAQTPTVQAVDVDKVLAAAELLLLPPPAADGAERRKPEPKKAIALFQRALAADANRAAALWGLSRAYDAAGDKATGRQFAALVVRSTAKDKTPEMASAAAWRLELPQ